MRSGHLSYITAYAIMAGLEPTTPRYNFEVTVFFTAPYNIKTTNNLLKAENYQHI